MRIAVSGTHGVGKTTLAEELCARLPGHELVPEPYFLLEEQGYEFDHPPSPADYVVQLRYSTRLLPAAGPAVVFDRSPLDFLAYLSTFGTDLEATIDLAAVRSALATLDLLVLVPVTETVERVLPAAEMPGLRAEMDGALADLVYADRFGLVGELPVIEVNVPLDRRISTVLGALR
ncbi:ATP-binding protein [Nocardia asteroides]|uniref:ATP/GTP-binding protein n=1 Tax=Nocardia asteroides TaxID=1824 RepID=UPI00342475D3